MEDLIRKACLHVEVNGSHVAEGHYDLFGPNGELIPTSDLGDDDRTRLSHKNVRAAYDGAFGIEEGYAHQGRPGGRCAFRSEQWRCPRCVPSPPASTAPCAAVANSMAEQLAINGPPIEPNQRFRNPSLLSVKLNFGETTSSTDIKGNSFLLEYVPSPATRAEFMIEEHFQRRKPPPYEVTISYGPWSPLAVGSE